MNLSVDILKNYIESGYLYFSGVIPLNKWGVAPMERIKSAAKRGVRH